jgi:hypothetical protein
VNGRPDFDELVGADIGGSDRERLRRTHELLLTAGPPPELSPELEAGPTLAMTMARERGARRFRKRTGLLLAAALAVAIVFIGGYVVGNHDTGTTQPAPAVLTSQLHGTAAAKGAFASLRVLPEEQGNWPMTLSVVGLPALPPHAYYEVYLVRTDKRWAPCGSFIVAKSDDGMTLTLNAPYELRRGDRWVVTKQLAGARGHGQPVLVPA